MFTEADYQLVHTPILQCHKLSLYLPLLALSHVLFLMFYRTPPTLTMPTMNCLLFPRILTLQTQSVSTCTLFIITVVLVIFATQVKKRRAEIKICAFFFFGFLVVRIPPLGSHCAVYKVLQITHKLD